MISFRRRLRVGVETSRNVFIGEPSFRVTRGLTRTGAHRCTPGNLHQSRQPPEHLRLSQSAIEFRETSRPGYPDTNPRPDPASIYTTTLAVGLQQAWRSLEPVGTGAGFSRFLLLAVGGGESHAAGGPCPTVPNLGMIEVFYVHRYRQAARDGARTKIRYQYPSRQPERLRRYRRPPER